MSTIDEKFSKLIAENTAVEEEVVEEEAATGDAAIKKGAVPPQKSDLKNDGTEVASNSKESLKVPRTLVLKPLLLLAQQKIPP